VAAAAAADVRHDSVLLMEAVCSNMFVRKGVHACIDAACVL
jgi:hypothetical protein